MSSRHDAWTSGESYDTYMGRWSRQIASQFAEWLDPPAGLDWLEIGCGTGALTEALLERCAPRSLLVTDRSEDFLRDTAARLADPP